ncbi:hypothetical protein, partial [Photobacterium leiognathi]|uniref:hypothetical protein n=1 Tax=Photobacterium leiognathi TaxID=553611 RepID=UPI0029812DD4
SVVKRNSADGSVGPPHVRVGHRQAQLLRARSLNGLLFALTDWNVSDVKRRFSLFNQLIKKMRILS